MRAAVRELRFLRARGYALPPAVKLVGDKHQLRDRQRQAIQRATSGAGGEAARGARRLMPGAEPPGALWVDGFNVVITCETALRGGVLVTTLDGGLRDLAGIHGSYRLSDITHQALTMLGQDLQERGWSGVSTRWLLDAPVSNTGRLAAAIRARAAEGDLPWSVEVVPDPDRELSAPAAGVVVATADAVVLDRCGPWLDWAAETIRARVAEAWIVDMQLAQSPPSSESSSAS